MSNDEYSNEYPIIMSNEIPLFNSQKEKAIKELSKKNKEHIEKEKPEVEKKQEENNKETKNAGLDMAIKIVDEFTKIYMNYFENKRD